MTDTTDFLDPFIERDARDETVLLLDLAASARAKHHESHRVSAAAVAANRAELQAAATAIAARVRTGGRLFTFGNGGSASDAALAAARFGTPSRGTPIAARCLADDSNVLTALGNDIGFDKVFARQLIAAPTRSPVTSRSASRRAVRRATSSRDSTKRVAAPSWRSASRAMTADR